MPSWLCNPLVSSPDGPTAQKLGFTMFHQPSTAGYHAHHLSHGIGQFIMVPLRSNFISWHMVTICHNLPGLHQQNLMVAMTHSCSLLHHILIFSPNAIALWLPNTEVFFIQGPSAHHRPEASEEKQGSHPARPLEHVHSPSTFQ